MYHEQKHEAATELWYQRSRLSTSEYPEARESSSLLAVRYDDFDDVNTIKSMGRYRVEDRCMGL